jgi:hypothetical protein
MIDPNIESWTPTLCTVCGRDQLTVACSECYEECYQIGFGLQHVRAEEAERRLDALHDQIEHGGCASSSDSTRVCTLSDPCGLCRLKDRIKELQAEVDRQRAKLPTHDELAEQWFAHYQRSRP